MMFTTLVPYLLPLRGIRARGETSAPLKIPPPFDHEEYLLHALFAALAYGDEDDRASALDYAVIDSKLPHDLCDKLFKGWCYDAELSGVRW